MAGVEYDGIAGIMRVLEAGDQPDTFAIEVITYHAAIESELEVVLQKLMSPRPELLFSGKPKLSFALKAKLLQATWPKKPEDADKLAGVLHAFQDLRDAVAHNDRKQIKACNTNLTIAYREIAHGDSDDYPVLEVAMGICLFLADGPPDPEETEKLRKGFEALGKFLKDDLPKALAALAREERA